MEHQRCRHCSKGKVVLDEVTGIHACSSCGRVEESSDTYFAEKSAFSGGGYVHLPAEQHSSTILTKKGVLNEKHWFETIDAVGHSIRLPCRVISEAKSLFLETSNVHSERMYGRKLFAGVLLFAACRQCGIPLTIPEMATVVGMRPSTFNKHYKSLSLHAQWTLPPFSLIQLIDRCVHAIQRDATDHRGQDLAMRGHAFRDECFAISRLFAQAEIDCHFGNPVFLSIAAIYAAWYQSEGRMDPDVTSWLCRKFGIRSCVFQHHYRKVRRHLVSLCSRIPGAMPSITIRNIEHHLPLLKGYYRQIHSIHEHLHGQKKRKARNGGRHSPERQQLDRRSAGHTLSYPTPQPRMESCIQDKIRRRMSLARSDLGEKVCKTVAENKGVSERTRIRQEKRKRGFDRFLQTINTKRKNEGQEEICSHCGTSQLLHQGKVMGYRFSLPFKSYTGDVSEMRKGCYNWTCKGESKKTPPSKPIAPPKVAAKLSDIVSDAEVESYLLKPHEVLWKKLCMEKLPLSEEK